MAVEEPRIRGEAEGLFPETELRLVGQRAGIRRGGLRARRAAIHRGIDPREVRSGHVRSSLFYGQGRERTREDVALFGPWLCTQDAANLVEQGRKRKWLDEHRGRITRRSVQVVGDGH